MLLNAVRALAVLGAFQLAAAAPTVASAPTVAPAVVEPATLVVVEPATLVVVEPAAPTAVVPIVQSPAKPTVAPTTQLTAPVAAVKALQAIRLLATVVKSAVVVPTPDVPVITLPTPVPAIALVDEAVDAVSTAQVYNAMNEALEEAVEAESGEWAETEDWVDEEGSEDWTETEDANEDAVEDSVEWGTEEEVTEATEGEDEAWGDEWTETDSEWWSGLDDDELWLDEEGSDDISTEVDALEDSEIQVQQETTPVLTSTANYEYVGCYQDSWAPRDLPVLVSYLSPEMSLDRCYKLCIYYPFFGLQNRGTCYCGTSFGLYGKAAESKCSAVCLGNKDNTCGGFLLNSVYRITK